MGNQPDTIDVDDARGAVPAKAGGASLALERVSKTFPGQMALVDVDLELRHGEIHALLGQNGSGKSTLIKILAGFHQPDPGAQARVDGVEVELGSPHAARDAGLRFIHQDLALVPELDAIDNLALGARYAGSWWLSARRERRAARQALQELDIDLDVDRPLRQLSPADHTMVAIARAMRDGADGHRLLVLDEPTAALGGADAQRLFALVRTIRDRGGTVLYVSHRLEEVFELADRVTVLRDGRRITTRDVAGLDHDTLIDLIVGRSLGEIFPPQPAPGSDVVLDVTGLSGEVVRDVSFSVRAREIVGVTGLVGSGREELPYLLFGARPWAAGRLRAGEREFTAITPRAAITAGMGFVPADRKTESALPLFSVRENLTLPRLAARGPARWLGAGDESAETAGWLKRLDVRPADPELPFASLSGGNQQKTVIGRWLRCGSTTLVMDEPTQGVDVGAKAGIYRQLAKVAEDGGAVIVFSSDVEELASLCDRVLILRSGRIAQVVSGTALTPSTLTQLVLRPSVAEHTEVQP